MGLVVNGDHVFFYKEFKYEEEVIGYIGIGELDIEASLFLWTVWHWNEMEGHFANLTTSL